MKPKFRAWWIQDEVMTHIDTLEFLQGGIRVSDGCWHEKFLGDEVILMQSTGFKDKNGTEIFVGDIVIHTQKSINYGDVYHNDYAEVFQQQNGAYRIRGKHIYEMDAFCNRKRLEMVGNIFENVELLDHDSFTTEK
ncbi:YopX family protein [Enterococcus xiangfangensis]|uniref:YopX family protein n=1 Tax=Enterococcus xiangfangensis TaxID=1296537 RepID=A0ABU3FA32_9ENTE|nr:YopX family protein [Enterococcus xiangfangensis]MDT2759291.1 YopX family protein [Enterococcus xiangfangensis]